MLPFHSSMLALRLLSFFFSGSSFSVLVHVLFVAPPFNQPLVQFTSLVSPTVCVVSLVSGLTPVMFCCCCFRWLASLHCSASRLASSRFACHRDFDLAFFAAFPLASVVARSNRSCLDLYLFVLLFTLF